MQQVLTTEQAVEYVNQNFQVIGNAMLLKVDAAIEVGAKYAQYAQHKHVITEELLLNAVQAWIAYREANPFTTFEGKATGRD